MDLKSKRRRFILEAMLVVMAVAAGVSLIWVYVMNVDAQVLQLIAGVIFTLSIVGFIWLVLDPDTHAARQSNELLQMASQTLECMKDGLTVEAAQEICELLLPATPAMAVAITDREAILGYAGYNAANNPPGHEIRTTATHETLEDGQSRILRNTADIGLPMSSARISAAIIQPLYVGNKIVGTLKFYYRRANQISKTQESLAHGFAELLSTQMAATALEEQAKLATSMELKALQAQINPHFLFNTINTIASLIRTDPTKARELLREFAVFYRSTLEDSDDLIELDRELKQVERYLTFEIARFGEDRLKLEIDVGQDMREILVPSFMIQPLVENAVKHGMRAEGQLTIRIEGSLNGDRAIVKVIDDGVGMSEETLENMMDKESTTGLGIAVKNVSDRISGYFGPDSRMNVESTLGEGTTVTFELVRPLAEDEESENAPAL